MTTSTRAAMSANTVPVSLDQLTQARCARFFHVRATAQPRAGSFSHHGSDQDPVMRCPSMGRERQPWMNSADARATAW